MIFKSENEFSLYIEELKNRENLTYIGAILHFHENESDHDFDEIVKMLNKKILSEIQLEAEQLNMLKSNNVTELPLF